MQEALELSEKSLQKLAQIMQASKEMPSVTSQVILAIVPMIGVLFGTLLFLSLFYFYHKQKMLMIEKGLYKPLRLNWNFIFIVAGLIMTLTGIVITIVFIINRSFGFELLGGTIPLAIGVAIVIAYFISNRVQSG